MSRYIAVCLSFFLFNDFEWILELFAKAAKQKKMSRSALHSSTTNVRFELRPCRLRLIAINTSVLGFLLGHVAKLKKTVSQI